MENTVPVLNFYAGHGYNARKGNFQGTPVFALSYELGQQACWGVEDDRRHIPDQISALPVHASTTWQNTLLMEGERDYEAAFSRMMQGEYTGVSYAGSAHSSLLYHGRLFQHDDRLYGLNKHVKQVLKFKRQGVAAQQRLDPAFAEAITSLPPAVDSQDSLQEYFSFFDTWGTHYVTGGTLGGMVFMETAMKKTLAGEIDSLDASLSINVAFHGMLADDSFSVDLENGSAEFMKTYGDSLENTVDIIGGQHIFDEGISGWERSIYRMPALLFHSPQEFHQPLTALAPLSRLALAAGAAPTVSACLATALEAYMAPPGGMAGPSATAADPGLAAHRNFMALLGA